MQFCHEAGGSFGGGKHSSPSKAVMIGAIPEQSLWYCKVLLTLKSAFPNIASFTTTSQIASYLASLEGQWITAEEWSWREHLIFLYPLSRTCCYSEKAFNLERTFATANLTGYVRGGLD